MTLLMDLSRREGVSQQQFSEVSFHLYSCFTHIYIFRMRVVTHKNHMKPCVIVQITNTFEYI